MEEPVVIPKIVIELSGNHGGNLNHCLKLVREARMLRPHSIKLQCFDPNKLAFKRLSDPVVAEALRLQHAGKQRRADAYLDLYRKVSTPRNWWPAILSELSGYPWSCSVFSVGDLEFMQGLGCPAYKIASFELGDLELIRACAATAKPLTLSVNYSASATEVKNALRAAAGAERITVLHATRYREDFDEHIGCIQQEIDRYLWLCEAVPGYSDVGLSDHSPPNSYALAAIAFEKDAEMFERHLCLPKVMTPDSGFSSTPHQMRKYIQKIKQHANTRNQLEASVAPRRSR